MAIKFLIALIAALHLYFLYLEMFAWTAPRTKRAFRLTDEFAEASKTLAGNQGLYNGFLAAGLIWSLTIADPVRAKDVAAFFLICIALAGIYGGMTVGKRIFFIQGLPALLALLLM